MLNVLFIHLMSEIVTEIFIKHLRGKLLWYLLSYEMNIILFLFSKLDPLTLTHLFQHFYGNAMLSKKNSFSNPIKYNSTAILTSLDLLKIKTNESVFLSFEKR